MRGLVPLNKGLTSYTLKREGCGIVTHSENYLFFFLWNSRWTGFLQRILTVRPASRPRGRDMHTVIIMAYGCFLT
jgi:hypothetical protein